MDNKEFYELIQGQRETRNIEFKNGNSWKNPDYRAKVIASIFGMTNLEGGGFVILGINQTNSGISLDGLTDENFDSFDEEIAKDKLSTYADPYVDFDIEKLIIDEGKFIVFIVREFDETPVICKVDSCDLKAHTLYVRTRNRRPETVSVPDSLHFREIIDLTVNKKFEKQKKQVTKWGYTETATDEQEFDKQLEAIDE